MNQRENHIDDETELEIEALLHKMTLREKVSLLSGKDSWNTMAIDRLGIPSLTMTDGPHGVRATQPEAGRMYGPATSFPTGVSMASSWDLDLVNAVGVALGEETRALGCDILLGPCVNIVRHPLGGRNFESYSEDPFLAGKIGTAYVKGVQSTGVGTSLKHFACNNQEFERNRGSSEIDERTLREIYLPAFEEIVKQAKPWTVMCSYNRINGVYASQNNHLLKEILKDEWGFDGAVVSDWAANHTVTESVRAGLDLEMPGPAKYYGNLLVEAILTWQISEQTLDEAMRRLLRMVFKSGKMDKKRSHSPGVLNTKEHQDLACKLAEESIVLLKNEGGLLPLDPKATHTIAVLGPNAADARIGGGGSSFLESPYRISPLEAVRSRWSDQVEICYEKGCDNFVDLPVMKSGQLAGKEGKQPGFWGKYYASTDFSGTPELERSDQKLDFWWFAQGPAGGLFEKFSVQWLAYFQVPEEETYSFGISNSGMARVFLDGKLIIDSFMDHSASPMGVSAVNAVIKLESNRLYEIRVDFVKQSFEPFAHLRLKFAPTPRQEDDPRFDRAVALASQADLVLFFAGMPEGFESEGADRPHMDLPGRQNELIQAVVNANPKTIVVLNTGAPVTIPWLDQVPAVLQAYYPGLEGGRAVTRILCGEVNPSGKLTVTYPKRLEDTPAFLYFPGDRKVQYGEGVFVGYRYYDQRQIEPLFPFGFGLSYTQFEYSDFSLPARVQPGEVITGSFTIRNSGLREGKEIAQIYVADLKASLPRPPKELKGFGKVRLQPGESQKVPFTLDQRAFSFYDVENGRWLVEPGLFEVLIGSSSQDIRLRSTLEYVI